MTMLNISKSSPIGNPDQRAVRFDELEVEGDVPIVGQAIGEYPGSKGHEEVWELARFTVRALDRRL